MRDTRSRYGLLVGLTAAAGVFGGAAMMSAATAPSARADEDIFAPDTSTFSPTVAEGYPPFVNVLQGGETWFLTGLPTGNSFTITGGVDTQTTFGSLTNDDFLFESGTQDELGTVAVTHAFLPVGTQIDLLNFGGGFENEWIDLPGVTPAITDTLITPFGDFTLF